MRVVHCYFYNVLLSDAQLRAFGLDPDEFPVADVQPACTVRAPDPRVYDTFEVPCSKEDVKRRKFCPTTFPFVPDVFMTLLFM